MSLKPLGMALIGAAMALAATPASADQYRQAADNAQVDCVISNHELTRISLIGDAFASVSKITTGYPYNDFTVPSGSPLDPNNGADPSGAALPAAAERQVKTVSFTSAAGEGGATAKTGLRAGRPTAPAIEVEDSPDFLPPNSYAPARVIVGVDASAGVASQTDPLPVVLRITGPARSVVKDGKLLTTRIQGCVINGAARGDLSAEKVYVKLQKMTCDQPGGRVAVSEVKGFISFAGKTGVRGRVVSREGSLVSQALLAGIVGGLPRRRGAAVRPCPTRRSRAPAMR